MKRVIIDLDVGTDDAYALMFLLCEHKRGAIQIEAITCVQGNTTVDNVAINVLRLLNLTQENKIPIFKGPPDGIITTDKMWSVAPFHGKDGFGDLEFKESVDLNVVKKENAILAINRIVSDSPKEISLICIGPLTNVALALKVFSNLKEEILELYLMGGNYTGVGNITASAEFNFHCDPEAANIVLDTLKCPIVIMPFETTLKSTIPLEWRFDILGKVDTPFMKLMNRVDSKIWLSKTQRFKYWMPCDAYLVAAFLYPDEIIERKSVHNVSVELAGYKTRGQVVLDHLKLLTPNATIIESVDEENFKKLFIQAAQSVQ